VRRVAAPGAAAAKKRHFLWPCIATTLAFLFAFVWPFAAFFAPALAFLFAFVWPLPLSGLCFLGIPLGIFCFLLILVTVSPFLAHSLVASSQPVVKVLGHVGGGVGRSTVQDATMSNVCQTGFISPCRAPLGAFLAKIDAHLKHKFGTYLAANEVFQTVCGRPSNTTVTVPFSLSGWAWAGMSWKGALKHMRRWQQSSSRTNKNQTMILIR